MSFDDMINRLSNCHPITEEDKETFKCAVECMNFTKEFTALRATPDRMKHALYLLNALEYALKNNTRKQRIQTYQRKNDADFTITDMINALSDLWQELKY